MKITSITIYLLDGGRQGWRPVVCRVDTNEGIYGYGEASLGFDSGAHGSVGMLKEISKLVIGMDPLAHEKVWNRMYYDSFWGQGGGPAIMSAISAIDIALWDIKGKVYQTPLYQLLGGKQREHLRAYASQLQFGWSSKGMEFDKGYKTEDFVAHAMRAIEDGYSAIKFNPITYDAKGNRLGFLRGPIALETQKLIAERVQAIRKNVGDTVDIMIENHGRTDRISATQMAECIKDYQIMFMEEACTPAYADACADIAQRVSIPIAGGERIFGKWNFLEYYKKNALAVAQPDIGSCGGITETKKIIDLANAFDITVQTHVCGSPIIIAASLQMECAITNFCIHEHHVTNLSEANISLGKYDYQPVRGYCQIPDLPGIGQELSEKAVRTALETIVITKPV